MRAVLPPYGVVRFDGMHTGSGGAYTDEPLAVGHMD